MTVSTASRTWHSAWLRASSSTLAARLPQCPAAAVSLLGLGRPRRCRSSDALSSAPRVGNIRSSWPVPSSGARALAVVDAAVCAASMGRTCGGIVTVRLPASALGSARPPAPYERASPGSRACSLDRLWLKHQVRQGVPDPEKRLTESATMTMPNGQDRIAAGLRSRDPAHAVGPGGGCYRPADGAS
jgi:hypothetical protein